MIETITESGMEFIADNVFHIEKSSAYSQIGDNVKSVEFVRSKGNKLLFVEAKSSFPNPTNTKPNPGKGNKTGFELFREGISDICDKFTHSLHLYSAIDVGVTVNGFPADYFPSDKGSLAFILVIKGFEKSWCDEIEMALSNKIRESICKSRIRKPEVYVINNETAATLNITV